MGQELRKYFWLSCGHVRLMPDTQSTQELIWCSVYCGSRKVVGALEHPPAATCGNCGYHIQISSDGTATWRHDDESVLCKYHHDGLAWPEGFLW